jgi:exonuclease SbcD
MRFLHTADWHLGRYFHGASLLDDQAQVLDELVSVASTEKVDAVLIAGDIYDRAIPPSGAVALLDDVLSRLVLGEGIPVLLIAGNHDSPDRVAFGGRIVERQRLILRGTLDNLAPVLFEDEHGTVAFHPLPYVEPAYARELPGGEVAQDHQSALTFITSLLRSNFQPGQRNILVGHAFVAGGRESESERPLSVGGSGVVSAETFAGFDFVALGHLHRPQTVSVDRIQYAGSLLKYSFNEVEHVKSVSVVEIGKDSASTVHRISLRPRHDARIVTGTLAELLAKPDKAFPRDDYLCAHLTDTTPVLEPMSRLREVYPNMMELQFTALGLTGASGSRAARDLPQRQPEEMFRAFYRDVAGEEIDGPSLAAFNASIRPLLTTSEEA